jgi:hypothetical protein
MSQRPLYESALSAALGLIHRLESQPGLSRPEKLAVATYLILDVLTQAMAEQPSDRLGIDCPWCLKPPTLPPARPAPCRALPLPPGGAH